MTKIKTSWIIEYWNNEKKAVECFSDKDGSWKQAPKEDVILVYIQRMGVRPYGRPDKLYTQILRGVDNYFFYEKMDVAVFGSWNDDDRETVMNVWYPDGRIESGVVTKRFEGVPDEIVKIGIWVEEPWAKELGLSYSHNTSEKPPFRRTIKGCYG